MKALKLKVGDIVRVVLEDHSVPGLDDVEKPEELTFEAFGRIVRVHPRSIVLQTWGYIPRADRRTPIDENTELLRILKRDVVEVRRFR